jgi:hypothetical protein
MAVSKLSNLMDLCETTVLPEEVKEWMISNHISDWGWNWIAVSNFRNDLFYMFANENDAIYFKLRWS